jgi:hypothetical protein
MTLPMDEIDAPTITITDGPSLLRLTFLERLPGDYDHPIDDHCWLKVQVYAQTPGFQADFTNVLPLEEISALERAILPLYQNLRGSFEVSASRFFWEITAIVDRGRFHWAITLTNHPQESNALGEGNTLSFKIENDQSYIRDTLNDLRAVREHFSSPVTL